MGRLKVPEKKIRLGSGEMAVLCAVYSQGGDWSKESGWVWENAYWTELLLDRLAGKGLVRDVVPGEKYELTVQGHTLAQSMPPMAPLRPRPVRIAPTGSYRRVGRSPGAGSAPRGIPPQ